MNHDEYFFLKLDKSLSIIDIRCLGEVRTFAILEVVFIVLYNLFVSCLNPFNTFLAFGPHVV